MHLMSTTAICIHRQKPTWVTGTYTIVAVAETTIVVSVVLNLSKPDEGACGLALTIDDSKTSTRDAAHERCILLTRGLSSST